MIQKRKVAVIQPKVRLKGPLHKRLVQAAERSGRSLNQEIVRRLELTFEREDFSPEWMKTVQMLSDLVRDLKQEGKK